MNLHRLDNNACFKTWARLRWVSTCDIATLSDIEFDENADWEQLTVLELKLLIHLALPELEEAHEPVGAFLQYNDTTVERGLVYP